LDFERKKAWIISFSSNYHFDSWCFVFVAYLEGRQTQNQPSIGSLITFQDLATDNSEPRDPVVIALIMHYFIGISKKKAWFVIFVVNDQFD
jgi:hypothetical protein